ncbi:hypothetical protein CC86DRAFT_155049 [Ophiobolus disseminans]|uniref:DUF6590 domain-containing protein n=1 Tax=Ophiobolus disseminans TaxID=1469910 RepID=A0A6A6ZC30_9PLEO|nr:hypothetical protein CC86DRAFT_155049 [Ophiobolus disseminans]
MPRGKGGSIYPLPSNHLQYEKIDSAYYVRKKDFFFVGRIFAVIMNETAGADYNGRDVTDYNSSTSWNAVKYKDNYVYTNVRRFVVVRQKREFCYACPIFTYSGKATTKRGVRPSEHGIAYSHGHQPQLLDGEGGITKPSIPVVMSQDVPALVPASRIYYGIHHPIQYNVKVKEIGYVAQVYVSTLIGNWKNEDDGDTEQSAEVTNNAEVPEEDMDHEDADKVAISRGKLKIDEDTQMSEARLEDGDRIAAIASSTQQASEALVKHANVHQTPDSQVQPSPHSKQPRVSQHSSNDSTVTRALEPSQNLYGALSNASNDVISKPWLKSTDSTVAGIPLDISLEPAANPRAFFKKGRVFMTLWAEPRGFSGVVRSEVTWFAVVKPSPRFSICLRIRTYSGQATTKPGVSARDYAAVIPAGGSFTPHFKGEELGKEPIEVKVENTGVSLDPMSRINFAKPYTVEHNVKIANIGRVVATSVGLLDRYFAESLGLTKP